MAVFADYKFYVDWNADEDFSDSLEDITSDVTAAAFNMGFREPPPSHASAGTLNKNVGFISLIFLDTFFKVSKGVFPC